MEDIRALQSKLPLNQLTSFGIGERAVSPAKIIVELDYDLFVREISEREEIVNHAYRVADAQAVFRGQRNDGFVLGNPIGTGNHLTILQEEISVIHQSKCWKTKTSASRRLESPARQQFIELVVDVRMADDFAAGIGQEQPFNDPEFFVVRLNSIRQRPVRIVA